MAFASALHRTWRALRLFPGAPASRRRGPSGKASTIAKSSLGTMNPPQEGASASWSAALCAAFGRGAIPKSAAQRAHSKTFGLPHGSWKEHAGETPALPGLLGAPLAAFLIFGLLSSGCRPEPRADVVIINGNEPESLDPAIVTAVPDMRIAKGLFEGLARLNGKSGRPEPGLAERWDVGADGRVYTFHLRTNAAWSTGEPITSADVLYSWLRALSPATASDYAGQLFYIHNAERYYNGQLKDPTELGIRALDPRTIQVELDYPLTFFLDLCCYPTLTVVP